MLPIDQTSVLCYRDSYLKLVFISVCQLVLIHHDKSSTENDNILGDIPGLFFLICVFSIQLTVKKQNIFANDWI